MNCTCIIMCLQDVLAAAQAGAAKAGPEDVPEQDEWECTAQGPSNGNSPG